MARQNKQGMRLRQTENPREKNKNWLLQMLCAMLGCSALLLSGGELAGFGGSGVMAVMVAVGVYLCAMYGLLLRSRKPDWFFIGTLMLLLILVLICRNQMLEGFRLFWSRMSDARLLGTGFLWPEWQRRLPQEQGTFCQMLFGVFLSGIIAVTVCFLVSRLPAMLAALLPVALLLEMAVFGGELSAGWMSLTLAAAALIQLCGGWRNKNALVPVAFGWITTAITGAVLILLVSGQGMNARIQQLENQVQKKVHYQKYETEHTVLPEGDFRNYQVKEGAPEAGLIVTMDVPEGMYLRGFTGSVFEDDQWKGVEKELLVKNKNLLYWLKLNAFHTDAQFYAASAGTAAATGRIIVQNTGACSRYRYVPFGLCGGEYLTAENLNTEGVLSDGTRVYSYTAVTGGTETISAVLQHLQKSDDASVLQYRQAESIYRSFVRNVYLQIPDSAKQLLEEQWDALAAEYGGLNRLSVQQSQECALRFLSQCFPENGIPEEMELPLDIARGTTYQYATVAVLTLRYFGIPARYAEGYVITDAMAASVASGETLAVDSSCARAWVEVYQDGIGWIPMDMTPGLGEMIQEDPDDQSEQGDGDTVNEELDPEDADAESPMESEREVPDPDGGSVVRIIRAILTAFMKVVLILLMVFLLLMLRRKMIQKKKEKRFQDENLKNAVAWIFADAVKILEKQGLDRGNGSLRQIAAPVCECYGEEYAQKLTEMIDLNDRAMFSSRPLQEHRRETMLQFRTATIETVKTHVKWYRRLWQKWVKCLY